MSKTVDFFKALWAEMDSVVELFVYLGIAFGISKLFHTTYLQAIGIVFIYFMLNLFRIIVETIKARYR